ncbi:hypothetical protein PGQ11_007967 [Apiospora arundinis]|uniref:Response regulatory domain-containing protein n=1 Tax=Apiospora arundinis TaxID=335852 RepID=A0ABR2IX31_9PEZI
MSTTFTNGDNYTLQGLLPSLSPDGVRFLVAEDNRVNQRMIAKTFSSGTHRTPTILENGLLAVQAYKADPGAFRCILMDWAMPVMGGPEATGEIRAFEAEHQIRPCVIIAMIATPCPAQEEKCVEDGCDAVLTKPLKLRRILELLFGEGKHNILHKRGRLTEEEAQSLSLSPQPPYIEPDQRSSSTRQK